MSDATRLATAAANRDPATGLRAVAALRKLLEQLEDAQVASARAQGWSWQDIADVLGVSRQAVHKKHAAHRKHADHTRHADHKKRRGIAGRGGRED